MPNNVKTVLKMEGIADLPIFTQESLNLYIKQIDFNKIIPMPEYLDAKYVCNYIDVAIEAVARNVSELYNFVIKSTMPDKLYRKKLKIDGISEEQAFNFGVQLVCSKVFCDEIFYEYQELYGWRLNNWGTRWNAYLTGYFFGEDIDVIEFQTACSFPEPVIVQLSKMYPEKEIEAWYASTDIGENTGHIKYLNGKKIIDERFESCSDKAYECVVKCWGESRCLYKDKQGKWIKRDCSECRFCD